METRSRLPDTAGEEALRDSCSEASFARGVSDGAAARKANVAMTPYVRVGLDLYARGYRAAYFARTTSALPGLPPERTRTGAEPSATVPEHRVSAAQHFPFEGPLHGTAAAG